jgi:putative nucleotidyltransferase with HDIG domain
MKDYKLTNLLRKHHAETYYHSLRVSQLCFQVARRQSLSDDDCMKIMRAGLLHDIGKIAVPAEILSMPIQPSEEEFAIIRKHVVVGVKILENLHYETEIVAAVAGHHEREDGRGYPNMSFNTQIHNFAKIVAVCDVYDAMTEKRAYKKAIGKKEVLRMMKEGTVGAYHKLSLEALHDVYQEKVEDILKFVVN